jgi:hypothetical protein
MKKRTREILDNQLDIMLECIQERGPEGDIPASIVVANDEDYNSIEFFFESNSPKDKVIQVELASMLLMSASSSRYGQLKKHLFHHQLANRAISPVLFKTILNPNLVVAAFHAADTPENPEDDKKDLVVAVAKERDGQLFCTIKFYAFKDGKIEVVDDVNGLDFGGWITEFINSFPFDLLENRDVIQEYFDFGRRLIAKQKMQEQGMAILGAGVAD